MAYSAEVDLLLVEAGKLYANKDYDLASEKYADACEALNQENGTDDPDVLFLYGKALFQSAVSHSEVFGGAPPQREATNAKDDEEEEEEDQQDGNFQFNEGLAEEDYTGPALAEEEDDDNDEREENDAPENELEKENTKADNENEINQGGEEEEEEQTDFEAAWEILDLTRSTYETELEKHSDEGLNHPFLKTENEESTNEYVVLTKKLSETYDLLGEVSLESENFAQAGIDFEKALALRLKLYKESSPLISESHYKLSLAYEFCVEDPKLKLKAIDHLKHALSLVQARNDTETDENIKIDNQELVQDLKIKLEELEKEELPDFDVQKLDILKGILGQPTEGGASSSSPATTAGIVNDLTSAVKKSTKKAAVVNDLTGIVRKRPSSKSTEAIKRAKK